MLKERCEIWGITERNQDIINPPPKDKILRRPSLDAATPNG